MRIVGDIPHSSLKITIFQHDSKFSIKFESGLYELTYKFRSGDSIDSVETIKTIVDKQLLNEVMTTLQQMHHQKLGAITRHLKANEDMEFEEII